VSEKLPEYVVDALTDFREAWRDLGYRQAEHDENPVNVFVPSSMMMDCEAAESDATAAILRYASEVRAAAVEELVAAIERCIRGNGCAGPEDAFEWEKRELLPILLRHGRVTKTDTGYEWSKR
jgi:hypothetical protein